jgi:hypothetical protein
MKASWLFRVAAVLLVIFAAGHTIGFLNFKPPTAQGLAVVNAMNNVHFQVGGANYSYGGFYIGFGLLVTAYLLFSAVLAWQLGGLVGTSPDTVGALGWSLFAVQLVGVALSWIYFFAPPAILSAAVALCLGWGTWLARTSLRP